MTNKEEIDNKALDLIKTYGSKELAIKVTVEIRVELKYKMPECKEQNIRFYYWLSVQDALNAL